MATRSWLVAIILSLAWVGAASAAGIAPVRGPVLVTIAGKIANTNRGAYDPFADGFLKFHEKTFEAALELDREAISNLNQVAITADAEPWPHAVKLRGPLLSDVLALAGAQGKTVTLFALDGYGVKLEAADLAAHRWVLGFEADGRPLGIGGRGPAWLAWQGEGGRKATADEEGKWVWSVFYITVE